MTANTVGLLRRVFTLLGIILFVGVFFVDCESRHRVAARRTCASNLSHINLAIIDYETNYKRRLPAFVKSGDGKPLYSWAVVLLRYVGEDELAQTFNYEKSWDSPENIEIAGSAPLIFHCPYERPKNGEMSFVALIADDPTDGAESPTVLGTIELKTSSAWSAPNCVSIAEAVKQLSSHGNGGNGWHVLLNNGEVHWFPDGARAEQLAELARAANRQERTAREGVTKHEH